MTWALSSLLSASVFILFFFSSFKAQAAFTFEHPLEVRELGIGNMLSWSTNFEDNNQFFMVEKSFNGVDFGSIGLVQGNGNSTNINDYRFLDLSANTGDMFYRLKQMDMDGSTTFSEIICIKRNKENNMSITEIQTTQVTNELNFIMYTHEDALLEYKILNTVKEVISTGEVATLKAGNNKLKLNISEIPNGTYSVELYSDNESEIINFVKSENKPTRATMK